MRVGRCFALWAALWMVCAAAWGEGRVYGRVTDGAGAPVAGAIVSFTPPDPWSEVVPVEAGRTDGDGRYAVDADEQAVAQELVAIWAEGFVPTCQTVPFEPGRAAEANFTLEEWASLTVRLIGPDGPMDGEFQLPNFARLPQRSCGKAQFIGWSHGDERRYKIEGGMATLCEMPPGRHVVSIVPRDDYLQLSKTITLEPGESGEAIFEIGGPAAGSIRAVVTVGGVPVMTRGRCSVTVESALGSVDVFAESEDRDEILFENLPSGSVIFRVSPGLLGPEQPYGRVRMFERKFDLAAGEMVEFTLEAANVGSIRCAPAASWFPQAAIVYLFSGVVETPSRETIERRRPIAYGSFRFETQEALVHIEPEVEFVHIEPGEYTAVLADGEGNPLAWETVQVVKDAVTRVSFE